MNQTTQHNRFQSRMQTRSGLPVGALARRRARGQAGQSITVAVIVLFLLMFLGGIFIAIVAGNIKSAQRSATTSAAGRFAEAGIKYLDDQLNTAAQGADWRSVPDCQFGVAACAAISVSDPDYRWLRPCMDANNDGVEDDTPCGFTRVNFGSDVGGGPDRGPSVGGRALVKLTYRPGQPPLPNNAAQPPSQPLDRYIKLESIGRVGQINATDPTTFGNSEAIGQRVELLAYKAIGLNEYVLNITNRENKPVTAVIGAPFPVADRGALRNIETVIRGPIRVNAGLSFYGINRIILDPRYNEAIEVSGNIGLNGLGANTANLTNTDPTQVYVYVQNGNNVVPVVPQGQAAGTPSIFPSDNPKFTTLGPEVAALTNNAGFPLVRDNPRGNETVNLPNSVDQFGNTFQNLRSVGRQDPPLIDTPTGPNGTIRYRDLTRNSPPLAPRYTTDNLINPSLGPPPAGQGTAGLYGWGQGMYIPNTSDIQTNSDNLIGGYSLRGDWLNPPSSATGSTASNNSRWRGDYEYVPEGVIITLYPDYFTVESSAFNATSRRQSLFRNTSGFRLPDVHKILRYTRVANRNTRPLGIGTGVVNDEAKFEGYPADLVTQNGVSFYEGEFVIFAEGNIRIRGVVGGKDPETDNYFVRHLTVVSNANIYIDGSILRDNISSTDADARAKAVQGRSSIALLAKNYIAVNTTQFLTPQQQLFIAEQTNGDAVPIARKLRNTAGPEGRFEFRTTFAPALLDPANGFLTPPYLANNSSVVPSIFLRHSAAASGTSDLTTNINLFINEHFDNTTNTIRPNLLTFPPPYANADGITMSLSGPPSNNGNGQSNEGTPPIYFYNRFDLPLDTLYPVNNPGGAGPQNGYPYGNPPPVLGQDNFLAINVDPSETNPQTQADYLETRVGIAPLDVRIEALMYAQEGSFFIIPGPWFNPDPNDTYENFTSQDPDRGGRRHGEVLMSEGKQRVNERYPFYKEPMDIRITFCGAITENLSPEIADQGAWLEKWGWIPNSYGSTGLNAAQGYPGEDGTFPTVATVHGPNGVLANKLTVNGNAVNQGGEGIIYEFDPRALAPYTPIYNSQPARPLRVNPYNPLEPLPFAPRLPVAPGLLYYGQNTIRP